MTIYAAAPGAVVAIMASNTTAPYHVWSQSSVPVHWRNLIYTNYDNQYNISFYAVKIEPKSLPALGTLFDVCPR